MFFKDLTVNWASKGFSAFWKRFGEAKLEMDGSPGDVYVCSPECHEEDKQTKMLTIIWCPIKWVQIILLRLELFMEKHSERLQQQLTAQRKKQEVPTTTKFQTRSRLNSPL
jgi:hypothetical protein